VASKVSNATRQDLLQAIRERYRAGTKDDKVQILQVGGALGHPGVPNARTMRVGVGVRRPPQLGHSARPLQEKGTSRSRWQSPQLNRANPPASQPHRKKSRNSCSTNRGSPSPSRKLAACARKVST
jgi:hypothetical protein